MEETLDMYKYMPEGVLEALGSNGLTIRGCVKELGTLYYELEGTTECGGDMTHVLAIKDDRCGSVRAWREAMDEVMRYFDPWEEAHKWLDEYGRPGKGAEQFESGLDLYNDLVLYRVETLAYTRDALRELERRKSCLEVI